MARRDAYIMLMTSLPHHVNILQCRQTPLSRLKLESRLQVLEEHDAEQLGLVAGTVHWLALQSLESDAKVVALARRNLEKIEHPLLRDLVRERLELRTAVAALRRRHRGEPPPRPEDAWGFGRWVPHIRNNWTDPCFRLEGAFPWLPQARRLLEAGAALELEKLLLTTLWDQLGRAAQSHYFDFIAVVVYVLRWDLIARWTSYDAQEAAARFAGLIEDGLGEGLGEGLGDHEQLLV